MGKYIAAYLISGILHTAMRMIEVQQHLPCWEISQNLMMSQRCLTKETHTIRSCFYGVKSQDTGHLLSEDKQI